MDKPLVKLYIVIIATAVLMTAFFPVVIKRVSAAAGDAFTRFELIVYGEKEPVPTDNGKGNAVIIMDDGWETQYTDGYEILKQYGMKANIAVIPLLVGTGGYMSYSQLGELYKAGWDMLNHTYDHVPLADLTKKQQQEEIEKGRDWLQSYNLKRGSNILVYPNGSFSGLTIQILKMEKVEAARSLNGLWTLESGNTLEHSDICNIYSKILIDRVKEAINKAVKNNGTIIIVFHKIEPVTDDTNMQIEEESFKNIIDCVSKSGLNVLTMSELLYIKNIGIIN